MKKKTIRCFAIAAATVLLAALGWGCVTTEAPVPAPEIQTLRVGFSPNYPPICMESEGEPRGLEADFAAAFAKELGCGLEIVQMGFDELIPALLDGRVDILMSGLTVTPTRAYKVRFTKPYLNNPLVAVTRDGWARSYASASQILAVNASIGVLRHTYGESFVRKHCMRARVVPIVEYDNVPQDLENNRYSIYVDDLAAILDLSAKHPGVLEVIPYPLQQQDIAWAVHPDNASLLSAANATLDKWKANGKLDEMLDQWLPDRFR